MKVTFKAKIVSDTSPDPRFKKFKDEGIQEEPTLDWVRQLIKDDKCTFELVPSLDSSAEPTLIITEK